jgi:integrase
MPRARQQIPTYLNRRGRGAVVVYRGGVRTEITLPGKFGSKESKEEYQALLARLRIADGELPKDPFSKGGLTIGELVVRFMEHAEGFYVHPGTKEPTGEMPVLRAAFRALLRLHSRTTAAEFGPLALKALRKALVTGLWQTPDEQARRTAERRPIGVTRSTVNHYFARIRLLFTWGVSEELIPVQVADALKSVAGLARGKSDARETEPVTPVSSVVIDDTLPWLPPVVRDMIGVLLLTGMRCGELCIMRARDLDMTGSAWLYRPATHKNKHRGMNRAVAIGPRAQAIIRKYLKADLNTYLFSPAEQDEMIRAARRAARKTPL